MIVFLDRLRRGARVTCLVYIKAPRLKNSVIAYLIVLSEYGMVWLYP